MNNVRFGLARFVMTTIAPFFSTMKSLLVSPGGDVMATGEVKIIPANAFV